MKKRALWLLLGLGGILAAGTGGAVLLMQWKRATNADRYLPALNAAEDQFGIPPDLLARMAYQESHFRDDIVTGATVSPAGALGLMQIVPSMHPGVNPLDVQAAISYAANFLSQLYNNLGSWHLAVAAYNAGEGNVRKYGGIPPFAETRNYVAEIFDDLVDTSSGASKVLYA